VAARGRISLTRGHSATPYRDSYGRSCRK
jgi:hypothetical protein